MAHDFKRTFRLDRFSRSSARASVRDELQHHIDLCVEELVHAGWAEEDAQQEATRQFGDLTATQTYCEDIQTRRGREERRTMSFDEMWQDFRYALRRSRRPGRAGQTRSAPCDRSSIGRKIATFHRIVARDEDGWIREPAEKALRPADFDGPDCLTHPGGTERVRSMRRPAICLLAAAALLGAFEPASSQEAGLRTLTPFQVTRVERYLETRGSCRGCHRIGGTGGLIGPTLDGLAERVDYTYVVRLIRNPAEVIPGTLMPRQPMPQREAERLAAYLLSRPAVAPSDTAVPEAPPALDPADRVDGPALYARHCAACHGSEGRGDGWNAPNLPAVPTAHADRELMMKRPDDTLYDAIAAGAFVLDESPQMPAFGAMLDPEQIRALVAHIRALCDCEQPTWARRGR